MNDRAWTRRDFGRMMAPALVAVPALAALTGRTQAAVPTELPAGLWPEALRTAAFYRKHLPAGHHLARPTITARRQAETATRSARFVVMKGDAPVGRLDLDASFRPGAPAPLWQSTTVAGPWYGASIANAFRTRDIA